MSIIMGWSIQRVRGAGGQEGVKAVEEFMMELDAPLPGEETRFDQDLDADAASFMALMAAEG